VFLPDDGMPDPTGSNNSADGWSDDRSLAGDTLNVDWLHFHLQEFIPPPTLQYLVGAARGQLLAARSEHVGLNEMHQCLEGSWHQVFDKHTSLADLFNSDKDRARKQSGLQQFLTGHQTLTINERCSDYNFCFPEAEVCKLLLNLRSNSEYDQVIKTDTKSIIS
jgi:hypothetical protein